MDKSSIEIRGSYSKPRHVSRYDPIEVERWHAEASYKLSFGMSEDIAKRLIKISDDLAHHVSVLIRKEEQLAIRRRKLSDDGEE